MPGHSGTADDILDLLDAMDYLFSEAKAGEERRAELRQPFFRPVTLQLADDPSRKFSAFSRDLSPMGIGLLHDMPLEPTMTIVTIPLERDQPLRLRALIKWCRPCGQGWYLSGGQFVKVEREPQ
jgi:hypothetical protein